MTYDLIGIRKDFPQLASGSAHYLDSQATSLTPRAVIDAQDDYYLHARANTHRAIFPEAARATELYEDARNKIAAFIGAEPDEIIFTGGATESSNMLIRMLDETPAFWENGKNTVVTSVMEHHASLVPLQQLVKRRGLSLGHVALQKDSVRLNIAEAEKLITDDTAIVSVMLASNVTGTINPISTIAAIAHAHAAFMIVDATAAIGHIPVNVHALGADALYFSGHKILGPTGVGVLWVKRELLETLSPAVFGGHMIAEVSKNDAEWSGIPDRFEPGTKNIGGVIALGAAIDYLMHIGVEHIHEHVGGLVSKTITGLLQIEGVHVIAEHDDVLNIGDVAFICDFAHPHDVAEILGRHGVAVRPGHHCALPYHEELGVAATTRVSFYLYNNESDIDGLVEALKEVRKLFVD
ncbi:MAG TPA: cysteine desulfurase [Candidatus Paceibacterota bacterium]|nr:cysteine desulfurase [Candidatus Paceibacterota bacterium]